MGTGPNGGPLRLEMGTGNGDRPQITGRKNRARGQALITGPQIIGLGKCSKVNAQDRIGDKDRIGDRPRMAPKLRQNQHRSR